MAKIAVLFAVLVAAFIVFVAPASADHNGPLLPIVPGTPLMQSIIRAGEYTWCVNSTAANYPGFVDQVHDVADRYTERTGIRHRQVAYDASCQVRHEFIPGLQCGGCAGQIMYANWPVTIMYKADLAYVDWRTTIGHELGHGVLGLHEQYDDRAFRCTGKQTTVMDCASGVRYPTAAFDVYHGCRALATSWCGPPPPPPPPCVDICFDGIDWKFATGWRYRPSTDEWFDPLGRVFWQAADQYGWRRSPPHADAHAPGTVYFVDEFGHVTSP